MTPLSPLRATKGRLKRWRRGLLFAHTFWTAARWLARERTQSTNVFRQALALGHALGLAARQRVDRRPGSIWWQRMKCCGRCPIYDRERKACGSLHDELGCKCFQPLKNGLPKADCWLWTHSGGRLGHDFACMSPSPAVT